MGDPGKQRRKYERPTHPWRIDRITEERELCKKYGLKNKREIWIARSKIRRIRRQARRLLSLSGEEVGREKAQLLQMLHRMGIERVKTLEDVLGLSVEDLLERRLQTIVFRKGLANTPKQARQLITHRHIFVGDSIVDIPSYIVKKDEEDKIKLDDKMMVIIGGEGKTKERKGSKAEAAKA
ncbi:MAG: 30S ribosomal protein S4 [Candidatus Altiarchaeales archaeon]|nr:MAG: 30S ribosomal protein S4 [Candidatus Altiarchaeales archaeon]